MAASYVLPGEIIEKSALPTPNNPSKSLKVGPGLQRLPESELRSLVAGALVTDNKKNAAWVEVPDGRYVPTLNDPVIATVQRSAAEAFLCTLSPHAPAASLGHLAFEGVSKKTRPQLSAGALVYARVVAASPRLMEQAEIGCVNPATGRADGLGELKGGMVFDVSLGFARRLLYGRQREKGGVAVLDDLADKLPPFEVAVGRNGRVWVSAEGADGASGVKETLVVGRALQDTDRGFLDLDEQRKLVKKLLKSIA